MLAEPMPTRDVRKGFSALRGHRGWGRRSHAPREPGDEPRDCRKRRRWRIMHLGVDGALPHLASELSDQPGTACVAACYRCLMSYYNQPDHELLDRRDEDARTLLLRLARGRTAQTAETRPFGATHTVAAGGISFAVTVSQTAVHRVARGIARGAVAGGSGAPRSSRAGFGAIRSRRRVRAPCLAQALRGRSHRRGRQSRPCQALEDLGFEVVRFEDPAGWRAAFARLASVLGQAS